jgi:hypothetical protein
MRPFDCRAKTQIVDKLIKPLVDGLVVTKLLIAIVLFLTEEERGR